MATIGEVATPRASRVKSAAQVGHCEGKIVHPKPQKVCVVDFHKHGNSGLYYNKA